MRNKFKCIALCLTLMVILLTPAVLPKAYGYITKYGNSYSISGWPVKNIYLEAYTGVDGGTGWTSVWDHQAWDGNDCCLAAKSGSNWIQIDTSSTWYVNDSYFSGHESESTPYFRDYFY